MMNNEEALQAEQNDETASEALNSDVLSTEPLSTDNAPVADSEIQNPSVELGFSEVSPVVAVSEVEPTASDTTQPMPIVPSEPAMFANAEPTQALPDDEEATKAMYMVGPSGFQGAQELEVIDAPAETDGAEPTPIIESTTPDVVSTPVPTSTMQAVSSNVQPLLPSEGDAIYVDHNGTKHAAFIEQFIAGGVKLIARLRLVLGGIVHDVPHSVDGELHSWQRKQ